MLHANVFELLHAFCHDIFACVEKVQKQGQVLLVHLGCVFIQAVQTEFLLLQFVRVRSNQIVNSGQLCIKLILHTFEQSVCC